MTLKWLSNPQGDKFGDMVDRAAPLLGLLAIVTMTPVLLMVSQLLDYRQFVLAETVIALFLSAIALLRNRTIGLFSLLVCTSAIWMSMSYMPVCHYDVGAMGMHHQCHGKFKMNTGDAPVVGKTHKKEPMAKKPTT